MTSLGIGAGVPPSLEGQILFYGVSMAAMAFPSMNPATARCPALPWLHPLHAPVLKNCTVLVHMEMVRSQSVGDLRDNTGIHQNGAEPLDVLGLHSANESLEQTFGHCLRPVGGHNKILAPILAVMPQEIPRVPLPHERQQQ